MVRIRKSADEINVAKELQEGSIFYYQQLIKLRKDYPVIAKGSYEAFLPEHPQIYGFVRRLEEHSLLVLITFPNGNYDQHTRRIFDWKHID